MNGMSRGQAPGEGVPGRRSRRRRSRRRRLRRVVEPFAVVAVLVLLSLGVIKAVEVGVPTRADYEDARIAAIVERRDDAQRQEFARALDGPWEVERDLQGTDAIFAGGLGPAGPVDPLLDAVLDPSGARLAAPAPAPQRIQRPDPLPGVVGPHEPPR